MANIKENELPVAGSISNSDYLRIVTSGGASERIRASQILDLLSNVEHKTLLWTNPNPTNDFAAQTVLSAGGVLSNYDAVEIIFKPYKLYGASMVSKLEIGTTNAQMQGQINAGGGSVPMILERPVTATTSGVQFSGCNSKSTNSSTTSILNAGCVPYKIYGIKY